MNLKNISVFLLVLATILTQCPSDCDKCEGTKCTLCESDKYLEPATGECNDCSVEDCEVCTNDDFCQVCEDGKYLLSTGKGACRNCMDGCSYCSSANVCEQCSFRYKKEGNNCEYIPFYRNPYYWIAFLLYCCCCLLFLALLGALLYLLFGRKKGPTTTHTETYHQITEYDEPYPATTQKTTTYVQNTPPPPRFENKSYAEPVLKTTVVTKTQQPTTLGKSFLTRPVTTPNGSAILQPNVNPLLMDVKNQNNSGIVNRNYVNTGTPGRNSYLNR